MDVVQIKSSKEINLKDQKQSNGSKINLIVHQSDISIWLVDPTYTQQQISSESMPSAVGGIATYTEHHLKLKNPIKIFKYPEILKKSLEKNGGPDIIGFSNYIWNLELSLALAIAVKKLFPDTIVVMGGPNYPVSPDEQESFLRKHPEIDFYIIGEGELAFANLTAALINAKMNKSNLVKDLSSIHYIDKTGQIHLPTTVERIHDLTEIPSPYTTGKLDEFFDGKLQPTVQTTRGCPFGCTFCIEGLSYYNKVNRNNQEKIAAELEYIGKKMESVRKMGGRNDLWIVDSNFGMYSQDIETCRLIAECQKKFGWPEYIQCDTGKNNKARILDAAKLVKGAIRLSGAVQSLDDQVLKNIKRNNISSDTLMKLAVEAAEIDTDSRSDIILGLPGESLKTHFETIKTVINAGFNHLNTFQLMMLPGTELNDPKTREQYKVKSRFRVLPRCFGYYQIMNHHIKAAEIEEICVTTNSLSFEDYLQSRKLHLLIHIFYNDGLFSTSLKFIKKLGMPVYRWLELLYNEEMKDTVKEFFDKFENDTRNELWEDREDLIKHIQENGVVEKYISGDFGYNLLFVYQGLSLHQNILELKQLAFKTLTKLLEENNVATQENLEFLDDVLKFDFCRCSNIFHDIDKTPSAKFTYAIHRFLDDKIESPIEDYKLKNVVEIAFILDDTQRDIINRSVNLYGADKIGISRILTKVFVKKLLRKPILPSQTESIITVCIN